MRDIQTVPNQRVINVNKVECTKKNKYTVNDMRAIDNAAYNLQSKGGFKLYMYIAKNQNKYTFALSSSDFCNWSGLGITAYNTAFKELVDCGYLKKKDKDSNIYIFNDYLDKGDYLSDIIIEYQNDTKEKVENNNGFIF